MSIDFQCSCTVSIALFLRCYFLLFNWFSSTLWLDWILFCDAANQFSFVVVWVVLFSWLSRLKGYKLYVSVDELTAKGIVWSFVINHLETIRVCFLSLMLMRFLWIIQKTLYHFSYYVIHFGNYFCALELKQFYKSNAKFYYLFWYKH